MLIAPSLGSGVRKDTVQVLSSSQINMHLAITSV